MSLRIGRAQFWLRGEDRIFGSRLPLGVRDADCDGRQIPLEGASERQLWDLCGPPERERISSRFAELNVEFLRDLILRAQELSVSPGLRRSEPDRMVGGLLWSAWICFRDRALREMRRGGELPEA